MKKVTSTLFDLGGQHAQWMIVRALTEEGLLLGSQTGIATVEPR
jgi:hypothetical protein